jgi:polyether ionophore transport system ATP-binding protein
VLLSSHILSEVEAVCDRVAMLRAGRIIESGQLDVLRGLAALHVRAELDGPPPDLSTVDGVRNLVVDGTTVECDVTGSMEALLRTLADAGVHHMTTREPSLEELFVAHYGPGPAATQTPATTAAEPATAGQGSDTA